MRILFLLLFSFTALCAKAQTFQSYKDTLNRFSINFPSSWKYSAKNVSSGLVFLARRTPPTPTDTVRDNFNINIIETPTKTLDKTFSDFVKYLPEGATDYKLIKSGDTTINGTKFKWLIETHKVSNIPVHNYDLVALKNGKTYILTTVTFSYAFDAVKPLFDKIAGSFDLY